MAELPSPSEPFARLSRREREIMDIVYARGSATSAEVHQSMPDPPSYSAVRAMMRILTEKGILTHRRAGLKYVFEPVVEASQAREGALSRLVKSLFNNSPVSVVATLLDSSELSISADDLHQLKTLIAKKEAKTKRLKS
jgi:predicted transcriptional regulator